jgi:hypothetical protein
MSTTKVSSKVNQINNANESKKVIASIPLKKVSEYKQGEAKKESLKLYSFSHADIKQANEVLKTEVNTLGHCLDVIIKYADNKIILGACKAVKKDTLQYEALKLEYISKYTTEKHGKPKRFSPYRVMQVLRSK